MLQSAGMCGSTAADDCIVEITVNGIVLATLYNHAAGLAPDATYLTPIKAFIPAGAEVLIECLDAANTNGVLFVALTTRTR